LGGDDEHRRSPMDDWLHGAGCATRIARYFLHPVVAVVTRSNQDADLRVTADPHRLEQAVQNLATNALRHTPPGGTVRLAAARTERGAAIRVTDSGVGIPPEHLPHVFDRFYKTDRSRAQSGSGLGLSIVKAIVERHGGTVAARSTPGVETTFEIVLPGSDRKLAP
jgi:two-component system sensor histidine kinase BaeS